MSRHRILVTGGSGFIGTNLMEALLRLGTTVLNLDPAPAQVPAQERFRGSVSILDRDDLRRAVREYRPTRVVHLAAQATLWGDEAPGIRYRVNDEGTSCLMDALDGVPELDRVLFTSTFMVNAPGVAPTDPKIMLPHTDYGESKARMERAIRARRPLPYTWAVVRPTTVWGPWMQEYYVRFFDLVRRGLYVHPGRVPVRKSLGYVGNTVQQILTLLEAPAHSVHERTFYLADAEPTRVDEWAETIRRVEGLSPLPRVPLTLLRGAARIGDGLRHMGLRVPLYSFRLRNMTTDWVVPMDATLEVTGSNPYSLEDGVRLTLSWIDEGPIVAVDNGPSDIDTNRQG